MIALLCFVSLLFPAVVYTTSRQLATTPDGCFYELRGRRVNCAQIFDVQTGIAQQQCLDLCRQTSSCQAVQYILYVQRCELFNITTPTGFGRRGRGKGSFRGRGNGQVFEGRGRNGHGGRQGSSSESFEGRNFRGGMRYRRKASMGAMRGWGSMGGMRGMGSMGPKWSIGSMGSMGPKWSVGSMGSMGSMGAMGSMGSSGSSEEQGNGRNHGGGRHRAGGNHRGRGLGYCGYAPRLVPSKGTNYYPWTNNCGRGGITPRRRPVTPTTTLVTTTAQPVTTTTRMPLPAGAECQQGDVPRYLKLEGVQLNGNDDHTFTANGPQQCIDACTWNALPDGTQAPCLSFDYNSAFRRCSITTARIPPNGNGQTTETPGTSYYEKVCLNGNLVTNCPEILQQFPQKILVGFARHVSTVTSYSQCIQDCLDSQAQFSFICRSGMFYYEENDLNCILNSEDRGTQPDLFTNETHDVVTYFETGCFNARVAADVAADISVVDPRKSVVIKGAKKWSPWSTCDNSENQRRRFRNCKSMNPKNCESEVGPCAGTANAGAKPSNETTEA